MKRFLAAIIILMVAVGLQAGTYTKPSYYVKTSDWDSVRVFIKVMNNGAEVDLCDTLITDNDTLVYTLDEDSAYHGHEQWYASGALFGQPSWTWDRQRTQANVVQISGDGTAADNSEYFFDGTGVNNDLDIKIRSLEITSDVGDAFISRTSASNSFGFNIQSTQYVGMYVSGQVDGLHLDATTGNAIEAAGGDILADIIGTVTPTDTVSTGDTLAVMPSEWVAADSAGFQGEAASLDSTAVYGAVTQVAVDSSDLYQGSASLDTTDIKTMIHGNFLPYTPPSPVKRYIYGSGDNTDGLTWATAWTGFDSIKTLTSPTKIWVGPGTYSSVACSLNTHGLHIESVYGAAATRLRGTNDTLYTNRMVSINAGSDSILTDFKIDGFSFAHRVGYGADDPEFKCAIWICDSVESVEIANCLFPADSNYKAISSENDWVRYLDIHDNEFAGTHVHAIDVAGKYGLIHNNTFFDMRDSASLGVRNPIQIYTLGTHNAVFENYIMDALHGIAINGGDTNLVASNYIGLGSMVSQSNSVDNVFAGNYGGSLGAYKRRDTGCDALSPFVEEEAYDYWSALQGAMGGYNIFYSPCQVSNNWPDSTDPALWGSSTGTVQLTSARYLEGYSRSMYIEEGSINTPVVAVDTGTYIMSAYVWLTSSTADSAYFQAYKADATAQTWTDGETVEYIVGHTGWRKISHTIRLTTDTLYYFTVGANTGDSAYFANVAVQPFAATGNQLALTKGEVADTLGTAHGAGTWTTGGDGGGSNTITVYAVDTSGTDEAKADTKLTVVNDAGSHVSAQWTNSSGYIAFKLDDGSYTVKGRKTGYVFSDYDLTVSGASTDTVLGYDIEVGTPGDADLSRVYGYLRDVSDNPLIGAVVTASRVKGTNAVDSSGTGVIISANVASAATDTLGYFFIDLYRTGSYADTTRGFYNISGQHDKKKVFDVKQLYIPDSGNVNLVDTLANRGN